MRRADREIRDPAEIESIIDRAEDLRLALWDGAEPYIVPLNFVRSGASLFFHSAAEGRKMEILREHPRVCFEATVEPRVEVKDGEGACACTTRYESVVGWGTARIIIDMEEKRTALGLLNQRYGAKPGPFPDAMVARVAVVRVDIDRMTGKANRRKA